MEFDVRRPSFSTVRCWTSPGQRECVTCNCKRSVQFRRSSCHSSSWLIVTSDRPLLPTSFVFFVCFFSEPTLGMDYWYTFYVFCVAQNGGIN